MRFIKFFPIIILAFLFSACSGKGPGMHSDDYIKQSQSVRPIVVPAGVTRPMQKAYYRVPALSRQTENAPMSLIPPGSRVSQYRHVAKGKNVQDKKRVFARLSKRSKRLVLSTNSKNAWPMVGRALQKAHYQVLDQDKGMGTYYVLDTGETGHKITQSTPIYRLVLKRDGKKSSLSILKQNDKPANVDIAERILTDIKKNLA